MNIMEEISKAVLGDEVGEMTPLEYANYLKELLEKSEKYDEIQECVPFVQHLAFEQVVKEYKTMQDKLETIEHHFENNDRMYVFDFNTLMDEVNSEFTPKGE